MKNVRYKKEILSIGLMGLAIVVAASLSGCGRHYRVGPQGAKGDVGATGAQGYGAGVISEPIAALCGATDGVRFTTFQDKNNNAVLDSDETITSVSTVCNGSNGTNGTNGTNGSNGTDGTNGTNGTNGSNGTSSTITFTSSAPTCVAGGYTVNVQEGGITTSFPICNGADGSQGVQGLQGLQGEAGSNGTNGTNGVNGSSGSIVTPVKFCNDDSSTFPEYGLYVDNVLFAVYWGNTPGSNGNQKQAFLTKLIPGSYQSTGGNNCQFTIN